MARQLDVRYINFYTDGSAARKVAPVEPLKPVKLPRAKKRRRIVVRIDPVATAGIVLSVVMLVLMCVGVAQLKQAQAEAAVMADYVDTLRQEQEVLRATYENGYDLAEVEKTALALGMVPADQVTRITLKVPEQITEKPGAWERFYTFLTGLFA